MLLLCLSNEQRYLYKIKRTMKKVSIILFFALAISTITYAQSVKNPPEMKFGKTVHDFGAIKEEVKKATCHFVFKNTGKTPLIINRVSASCGCTSPSYTREPILPGKRGKITVTYSTTNRPGSFNKRVTVYTNVPDSVYVLRLKGTVIPKKQ